MINPNQANHIPKQFLDSTLNGFQEEALVLFVGSGDMQMAFAFNPKHYKQFVHGITENLKAYETKYGPILASNNPIPSPIQMDDLDKK